MYEGASHKRADDREGVGDHAATISAVQTLIAR